MSDYSELKKAAEVATPGPWEIDEPHQVYAMSIGEYVAITKIEEFDPIPAAQGAKNSLFIAAANPAAVLAMIAENEALRRLESGLREMLRRQNKEITRLKKAARNG